MKQSKLDYFYNKAKIDGYFARSIYKLEELDTKYKLINKNTKIVLDLGASPGSWLQYIDKKINNSFLIANDINDIKYTNSNINFIKSSVFDLNKDIILNISNSKFDLVLSDMAPKTSGIKLKDQADSLELSYKALELAIELLKLDANFVCKYFNIISPDIKLFTNEVKKYFKNTYIHKPKSSTRNSYENFIIGINFKN